MDMPTDKHPGGNLVELGFVYEGLPGAKSGFGTVWRMAASGCVDARANLCEMQDYRTACGENKVLLLVRAGALTLQSIGLGQTATARFSI